MTNTKGNDTMTTATNTRKRTMRVRAVVDVTLDVDAYAREYGYDPDLDDIAADARDWVRSMVAEGAVVTFAPFSPEVVKSIMRPR